MPRSALYLLPGLLCDSTVWRAQAEAPAETWDIRTPDFLDSDSLTEMAPANPGRSAAALFRGRSFHGAGEAAARGRLVDLVFAEGMAAVAKAWQTE